MPIPVSGGGVLRLYAATLVTGEVTLHEHAACRWLAGHELHDVPWLPADLPLVDELPALLEATDQQPRLRDPGR